MWQCSGDGVSAVFYYIRTLNEWMLSAILKKKIAQTVKSGETIKKR